MKNNQQKITKFINFGTCNRPICNFKYYALRNLKTDYPLYLVYQYKSQTNFNMFKEHIETTAFKKNAYKELWLSSHAWSLTWRLNAKWRGSACHPPIFSGWTVGSEPKVRNKSKRHRDGMPAKKAEKEKNTKSNWNKFAAIA